MKKLILAVLLSLSALTPFVIAACPSPNYPPCPLEGPLAHTTIVDTWTCCNQTAACSTNGTKYPRFNRSQHISAYLNVELQWVYCGAGAYTDSSEINCCD